MKNTSERLGLILAIIGLITFWVPPVGLFVSIAAIVVTLQKFGEKRPLSRAALAIGILALAAFIGFWATVWALSQ
jgi:hypothetical protein